MQSCAILLHRIITQGIHHERSRLPAVSLSLGRSGEKLGKNANEQRRAAKPRGASSAARASLVLRRPRYSSLLLVLPSQINELKRDCSQSERVVVPF